MSELKIPKVTVCIPTYNYGRFIGDAINSVLTQTFTDLELIIVDNCSTDDTSEVVAKFVRLDSRVRYYCNKANIGMVGNWNKCLGYARGDYVNILCADDLLQPDFIAQAQMMLSKDDAVALVGCSRTFVRENLEVIFTRSFAEHDIVLNGTAVINRCLIHMNLIGEPTAVLFRRPLAKRGFSERYRHLADLEMWFHLLESGKFCFINEPLCSIRLHAEQETNYNVNSCSTIMDEITLINEYFNRDYISISQFEKIDRKLNTAYSLWIQSGGNKTGETRKIIDQQCNAFLFFLFCVQKRIRRFLTRPKCSKGLNTNE